MDRDHLLQVVQPMLVAFKREIAKMRSDGAPPRLKLIRCSMNWRRPIRATLMLRADWSWQFFGKQPGNPASQDSRNPFEVIEVPRSAGHNRCIAVGAWIRLPATASVRLTPANERGEVNWR